ncbi:hypothetical protein FKW77_008179 [Venturia effusa]|uniref:EH domain-containing protein n=1 Tax=Venturia effusa TaxID=50376 RepID=A0A517LKM2_9PEZI|nr:hypothetical protein FKW77_008179 [Venturia effusa]
MTKASSTPSNKPSRSSTPHNVPNAALIASSRAFAKTSPKTPLAARSYSSPDGALSATKSVNSASSTRRSSITSGTTTLVDERDLDWELTLSERRAIANPHFPGRPKPAPRKDSGSGHSSLSANNPTASSLALTTRSRFPSPLRSVDNSEATFEEDKYTEVWDPATRTLRKTVKPVQMAEGIQPRRRRSPDLDGSTDGTPIAPTTSLVKLFEQQNLTGGMKPGIARKPSVVKGLPPPIVSPKPQRIQSYHTISPELDRPILKPSPKRVSTITIDPVKAIGEETGSRTTLTRSMSIPSKNTIASDRPALPPPRRPRTKNPDYKDIVSSTIDSSPVPKSRTPATQHLQNRGGNSMRDDLPMNSKRPAPAPYKDSYIKTISPHITGDSLANAMVGANLAIRHSPPRHTPLSKTPPPIPAPRRKKEHDHHLGGVFHRPRSLSPPKKQPMTAKTLRKDKTGDSAIEIKHHMFRHPNKHHEATRERWQDKVDEAALKRYEGVWASNRGIYIQDPAATEEVAGIVVRDIWSRSGLPLQKLAQIWVLVGGGGTGSVSMGMGLPRASLTKEQFVVGMYFIDRVLKGRNLPQVVGESVWDSVRPGGLSVAFRKK